jgi:CubicO group peptidase (beta-lactamase class C family)
MNRIGVLALSLPLMQCTAPLTRNRPRSAVVPEATVHRSLDGRQWKAPAIDARVEYLMQANRVKGLALALIREGRVSEVRTYGLRDVERNLPLTPDTIMYGASLTKATFAYMVMQLVDEGRVDLDRLIGEYLPKPLPEYESYVDLASDPRWRQLTMRMLLDHTPGFANFRFFPPDGPPYDPNGKLKFYFDPGSRYAYSGEGILLAQRVLEFGLGLDVGAEIQRRVFDRFGMARTSMRWRDDFAENVAQGYTIEGTLQEHNRRGKVGAPGSMDTTIQDWSRFLAGVVRGEGLSAGSKAEMIRRQISINSVVQFPTLRPETTDAHEPIALGYGLGWGVFETPFGHAFFKEGHDDGTANYGLCVEARRACILVMSNDVRAEGIMKPLVDDLMGETNLPWKWENYIPYDQAGQ